ncbi:hypothetical protein ACFY93_10720 [Streptomyces sp. NPDC008313]|uniref:hypothetical protein n=1 Tax=Streptomyces sp. NPDC008313 TaxID=3364826 RepID=UPI0036E2A95A
MSARGAASPTAIRCTSSPSWPAMLTLRRSSRSLDATLIYDDRSGFWGDGGGRGRNWTGRLL